MSPELYLAFVVATVIALVVPGPTILLVVSYALARGRNVTSVSYTHLTLPTNREV